jgi:hypothetical protein
MPSRHPARGNALLLSIIVVLVMTVAAVGVIRFASREVAGANAARRQAGITACADAARTLLMSKWKVLGTQGMEIMPVEEQIEPNTPTTLRGGHYGEVNVNGVQVIRLNPLTVGASNSQGDITNRIADQVSSYRVVVHCTQGPANPDGSPGPDARELEVEFGVTFGI